MTRAGAAPAAFEIETPADFGFDADLAPLHRIADRMPRELGWVRARGAGRLMRSPTVFEDAVKVLCTTHSRTSARK